MRRAARQLFVLTLKELRQLLRDRALFGFVLYIFSLHLVISTLGATDDLRRAATVVHDGDQSPESRELLQRFRPPYFKMRGEVSGPAEGARALDDGRASVVIDVPEDFSETLGREDHAVSVQVLVDTSKVSIGYLASSYASRIANGYGKEIGAERLARRGVAVSPPTIENEHRTWFNFTLDARSAKSLYTLLTMMTVACVMLPAAAAVREKERGTIEQLLVSPLTPLQIMIAKVAAMTLVTLAGTAFAFYAILHPVFGLPMRGSPAVFFFMVGLYAFALSGLGLALATFARSSAQVGLLVVLTVLPMLNLSGLTSPIEGMPEAMRWGITMSPLYHFAHIVYGIAFRGEGLVSLWPSAAALTGIGGVLFALGLWRFRKQFT